MLKECPNIGKVIENYVEDHSVGANAWRRTGVLTFDGNVHLKQKVTFKRIQNILKILTRENFLLGWLFNCVWLEISNVVQQRGI